MKKKPTPETLLKKSVIQLLKVYKIYNFPLVAAMGSPPGLPDRIAIIDGKFIGIEFKSPNGKLSEYQQQVKEQIEKAGGQYIICHGIEDVIEGLGLPGRLF